ncbi:MAG: hypothetical protein ACXU8R_21535 [Xanthobacteraceae bacterium]
MKTNQLGVAALVAAGLVASILPRSAHAADQLLSGTGRRRARSWAA